MAKAKEKPAPFYKMYQADSSEEAARIVYYLRLAPSIYLFGTDDKYVTMTYPRKNMPGEVCMMVDAKIRGILLVLKNPAPA